MDNVTITGDCERISAPEKFSLPSGLQFPSWDYGLINRRHFKRGNNHMPWLGNGSLRRNVLIITISKNRILRNHTIASKDQYCPFSNFLFDFSNN